MVTEAKPITSSQAKGVSMSDERTKHLEFIQSVITRMNTNCFQIKTWTITISSGLLAISANTKNPAFVAVAIFPVIMFWILDSYYLTQERKFRGLYNDVAGVSPNPREIKPFEMSPDLYVGEEYSFCNILFSDTLSKFYMTIIVILIVLVVILMKTVKGA